MKSDEEDKIIIENEGSHENHYGEKVKIPQEYKQEVDLFYFKENN